MDRGWSRLRHLFCKLQSLLPRRLLFHKRRLWFHLGRRNIRVSYFLSEFFLLLLLSLRLFPLLIANVGTESTHLDIFGAVIAVFIVGEAVLSVLGRGG